MTTGLHEEMNTAIVRMRRCTDDNVLSDVRAAVGYIKTQSFVQGDKIGIVRFCDGGRVSYLASCTISDISASVIFYWGASAPRLEAAPRRWGRRPISAALCWGYLVRTT